MKKILLIDDETIILRLYQRIFTEENGFQLDLAKSGEEGLQKIKQNKPDLILLDIRMPKIHGIEVLRLIKQDNDMADIPVLMLTNIDKKETVADAISLGAKSYLVKTSHRPDEIVQKVRDALA